jgi:hypothetical protein
VCRGTGAAGDAAAAADGAALAVHVLLAVQADQECLAQLDSLYSLRPALSSLLVAGGSPACQQHGAAGRSSASQQQEPQPRAGAGAPTEAGLAETRPGQDTVLVMQLLELLQQHSPSNGALGALKDASSGGACTGNAEQLAVEASPAAAAGMGRSEVAEVAALQLAAQSDPGMSDARAWRGSMQRQVFAVLAADSSRYRQAGSGLAGSDAADAALALMMRRLVLVALPALQPQDPLHSCWSAPAEAQPVPLDLARAAGAGGWVR